MGSCAPRQAQRHLRSPTTNAPQLPYPSGSWRAMYLRRECGKTGIRPRNPLPYVESMAARQCLPVVAVSVPEMPSEYHCREKSRLEAGLLALRVAGGNLIGQALVVPVSRQRYDKKLAVRRSFRYHSPPIKAVKSPRLIAVGSFPKH